MWLYCCLLDLTLCFLFFRVQSLCWNYIVLKIKSFRFDGCGEFMSNRFKKNLACNGITCHISCLHTWKQNGVVKIKNRHIVEMSFTLFVQAKMLLYYWVKVFNTAVFLLIIFPQKFYMRCLSWEHLFNHPPQYIYEVFWMCLLFLAPSL